MGVSYVVAIFTRNKKLLSILKHKNVIIFRYGIKKDTKKERCSYLPS